MNGPTPSTASGRARRSAASAIPLLALSAVAAALPAAQLAEQAEALVPDAQHGRILYLKHCASCHGRHAWGDGPREIPTLAGQRPRYLVAQLARFAAGERTGSVMHGPAMHEALQPPDVDRPQSIADLAAYLAHATRNPRPTHAEDRAPVTSSATYVSACSGCHGADGAGRDPEPIPAIGGQHYDYLLSRLHIFALGGSGHPAVAQLRPQAMVSGQQELADFISRQSYLSSERSPEQ